MSSVHRFFGANSREAMNQVREALGDDAMIVANRAVDGGIEILAVVAGDIPPAAPAPAPASSVPPAAAPASAPPANIVAGGALARARANSYADVGAATADGAAAEPDEPPMRPSFAAAVAANLAAAGVPPGSTARLEPQVAEPAQSVVQDASPRQMPALAGRPARAEGMRLYRRLLAAGFSSALARALSTRLPEGLSTEAALDWVRREIASRLPVEADENAWLGPGGVFALVGPTGVGKTTSTAKLAARCVLAHGRDAVAMLTTDGYRIGAHEQLRIYGRILGIPVLAVTDGPSLQQALHELRDKHIVLIDTIGMSQRDRKLAEQAAVLCAAGRPVRRLLLLNAASHGDTLDEVAHAYQHGAAGPLTGCILTKLDEARRPGSALDVVIRHRLPIHYVSDGQRVPENFGVPKAAALVERAFAADAEALFVPTEDDWMALASTGHATATPAATPVPVRLPDLDAVPAAPMSTPGNLPALQVEAGARRQLRLRSLAATLGGIGGGLDVATCEAALDQLHGQRSFVLARELWRAALSDDAPVEVLRDLAVSDVSAHAPDACEHHLLALHGRLNTPRQAGNRPAVAGSLLRADRGGWMASPAQHLLTPHGLLASFGDQAGALPLSAAAGATLARARWLERTFSAQALVHIFDGISAAQAFELQSLGLRWLARCSSVQSVLDADGNVCTALALTRQLGFQPAGRVPGSAGLTRWVAGTDTVLRGQRGSRLAVQLIAVRHLDAAGECRWQGLGLADAAGTEPVHLAEWLEAADAARAGAAWTVSGVDVCVAAAEPDAAAWSRHLLVGAQLGLAAWQLSQQGGAAARLLGVGPNAPTAGARRAGIDRLTRAFGALDMLEAAA